MGSDNYGVIYYESLAMNQPQLSLAANSIDFWMTRISEHTDAQALEKYRTFITDAEQIEINKLRFENNKKSALITRGFIRTVLSHYAVVAPQDWRFNKTEHGKPGIFQPPIQLKFNLSHSGDLIVAGITSTNEIGVDVQFINQHIETDLIAEQYFSKQEFSAMQHLQDGARQLRFFELWVLKEALIKTSGIGLSKQLNTFSFDFDHKNPLHIQLENTGQQCAATQSWLYKIDDDYRSAITVNNASAGEFTLRFFEIVPNVYLRPAKTITPLRKTEVTQIQAI